MAMFDKHKSSKQTPPKVEENVVSRQAPGVGQATTSGAAKVAMIGQGVHISGDVTSQGNLKVDGRIEGRMIQSSSDIEIGESGTVVANISAKMVKVSGEVSGDLVGSEKVMISGTGRVQGNIVAPRVQLEDGALFRGSIEMNPAKPAATEKPAAARPAAASSKPNSAPVAASQAKASSTDSGRKEPSLTLKSG